MKWHVEKDGRIALVLERGEKVRQSIENLVNKLNIKTCKLSGIGAVYDIEVGSFNLETKEYHKEILSGCIWEVLSLLGNVTQCNNQPMLHMHISAADENFNVRGGHFFEAETAVTFEIFIEPWPTVIQRSFVEDTGLYAWDPGKGNN